MDKILKKLSEIEEATANIMEQINIQKKEYSREMEEKVTRFDSELDEKTNQQLDELRQRLRTETEKKLAEQKLQAKSDLQSMEENYTQNHTLYVKQIVSSMTQL